MKRGRLESFSDGVMAIIITIMVLELKIPNGDSWAALYQLGPKLLSYVLSFIYVGIYWNNHHHMLHTVERVSAWILWSNLHLLFWLSLLPFATRWVGENHFIGLPVAVYSFVLLIAAVAYEVLERQIIRTHGYDSILAKAIGKDFKGKISILFYLMAITASFLEYSWIAGALLVAVAIMWFLPDRRIEKNIN